MRFDKLHLLKAGVLLVALLVTACDEGGPYNSITEPPPLEPCFGGGIDQRFVECAPSTIVWPDDLEHGDPDDEVQGDA